MGLIDVEALGVDRFAIAVVFGSLAVVGALVSWLFSKPPMGKGAPKMLGHSYPLIGALQFFTQRMDFIDAASKHSSSGNFSFYAGQYPVVNLDGRKESNRKLFFETKALSFNGGYGALLGGSPQVSEGNVFVQGNGEAAEDTYESKMPKRFIVLLKGNELKANLPKLLSDVRNSMERLKAESGGITNPFDSVYEMVYQLTMRTVACNEIANDRELLLKTLRCFEMVETTGTPMSIMWPMIPVPAKFKRAWGGYKLYAIMEKIVNNRKKTGARESDALQHLIDEGDDMMFIITFILGALFAGQLNSGVNAAWILVYLASKPEWFQKVQDEVEAVAEKWTPNDSRPLKERLMDIPVEGWENDFPMIDLCLKDSIRLQLVGTMFRRNMSNNALPLDKEGKEVIPPGAYVSMAINDYHFSEEIYKNESEWDPSRYLPDRAEDKNSGAYAWSGWGAARHPCLGMRFAKLENNLLVAFFAAYFYDIKLSEADGTATTRLPTVNRNGHTASKPKDPVCLKFKIR